MKFSLHFFCFISAFLFLNTIGYSQNFDFVRVISVYSGNETNNTLFKVKSPTIPGLTYIRAQIIGGPQDGFFTQKDDDIRYTSLSKVSGIPGNLSKIRFTFLKSDKKTHIPPGNFRFIINDIDGPDNEALATNCTESLKFLGTANPTNLTVINLPSTIIAVGALEESDGATSRVMFEFNNIAVIELENYANQGYLKDFDMDNDYPIAKPLFVKCKNTSQSIFTEINVSTKIELNEFKNTSNLLMINTKPIYFDLDKYFLRKDAVVELEKVLLILRKYDKLKLEIRSHTDARANDHYNKKLSEKRAKSVVKWLVNQRINKERLVAKGFGETQLINKCSNGVECTEKEHQINRRVEFVILNPETIKK